MSLVNVFVTRHCLSQGIRQMQGTVDEETGKFNTTVDGAEYEVDTSDWFLNRENAVKKAQKMQKDKVSSLRRYANKIESITFDNQSNTDPLPDLENSLCVNQS